MKYNNAPIPNTFGLKANAATLIEFGSVEELIRELKENKGKPFLCVGCGSNLLLCGDYDGIVLRSGMKRVLHLVEDDEYVYIDCGAGIILDELIEQVCDMGLFGLENLSYIPGTVGASAVQNVGAYRTEAKDLITEVHAVEIATATERVFTHEECQFGYRRSVFKGELAGQYVITSVTYRLRKPGKGDSDGTSPMARRAEIIATRRAKLPEVSEYGSAGSFFMNPIVSADTFRHLKEQYPDIPGYPEDENNPDAPVKLVAAWLIDQAGLKGEQVGGARVWDRQPLVIINTGSATADDILALARKVQDAVSQRFGISLQMEVECP